MTKLYTRNTHIELDSFVKNIQRVINTGIVSNSLGVDIMKMVSFRTRKEHWLGEDYKASVILNTLTKLQKLYIDKKRLDLQGKKPLQVLSYVKNLINFAAFEERTKLNRLRKRSVPVEPITDKTSNIIIEGDQEALYHFTHEKRINGYSLDVYNLFI